MLLAKGTQKIDIINTFIVYDIFSLDNFQQDNYHKVHCLNAFISHTTPNFSLHFVRNKLSLLLLLNKYAASFIGNLFGNADETQSCDTPGMNNMMLSLY